MNTYVKMAKLPYNKHNFKVRGGHIEEIYTPWHREDISNQASGNSIDLTPDEIDEVMYSLVKYHDANCGICWDVINCHIDDVVRDRKNKIVVKAKKKSPTEAQKVKQDGRF